MENCCEGMTMMMLAGHIRDDDFKDSKGRKCRVFATRVEYGNVATEAFILNYCPFCGAKLDEVYRTIQEVRDAIFKPPFNKYIACTPYCEDCPHVRYDHPSFFTETIGCSLGRKAEWKYEKDLREAIMKHIIEECKKTGNKRMLELLGGDHGTI